MMPKQLYKNPTVRYQVLIATEMNTKIQYKDGKC